MTKTITIKNLILSFTKIKHYSPWILTALLYTPVFFVLYRSRWASSDYTHAYFILPVFLWLVWRKRGLLREHLQKINPSVRVYPHLTSPNNGEEPFSPAPGGRGEGRGLNWYESMGRNTKGNDYSPPLVGPVCCSTGRGVRACPVPDTVGGGELLHPISSFFGLFMLVFGASMFIFGWRQDYIFFKTLSLLPVIYGLTTCLYGLKIAKVLSFTILYLLLLIPIPLGIIDSITLPMRYGVSVVTETILKLLHYPITREGLLLSIGNNELFIGQPCSGFRSLITMFSAGLVYVFISKTGSPQKSVLVASIIPLALLGNLFRIIILCLITYYFGEAAGQGFFHNFSGIMMVVLITAGLIGLEYCLGKQIPITSHPRSQVFIKQTENKVTVQHPHPTSPIKGEETFFPRPWWEGLEPAPYLIRGINKKVYVTNAVLLFTIIFCFAFSGAETKKYVNKDIISQLEIPYQIGDWSGKDVEDDWNLDEKTSSFAEQSINREYVNKKGESLFLLVLNVSNLHTPKSCASSAGFKIQELDDTEFSIPLHNQGENYKIKAYTLHMEKDTNAYLIFYWICIDKKRVDWVQQKMKLLWFSMFNAERVNIMMRLDIPSNGVNLNDSLKLAREFVTCLGQSFSKETSEYLFGLN